MLFCKSRNKGNNMQAYFPESKACLGNIFYYFLKVHVLWND